MDFQKNRHELTMTSSFQFAPKGVTRWLLQVALARPFRKEQLPRSSSKHLLPGLPLPQGPRVRKHKPLEKVLAGAGLLQAGQERREWLFVSHVAFYSCYSGVLAQGAQQSRCSLFTFKNPGVWLLIDIWELTLRLIQSKLFSLRRGINSFRPSVSGVQFPAVNNRIKWFKRNFNPPHLSYKEEAQKGKVT